MILKNTILVVAAHPDDEVLGCGGTIARRASEGNEVITAILGEGVSSRYESRNKKTEEELIRLKESAKAANEILGTTKLSFHDFPDNKFDTVPFIVIVRAIERLIRKYRPKTIYTHCGYDLNIDHSLTFRATLTAARPMPGNCVEEIYSFEIPSSTEWGFNELGGTYNPNYFVDIEGYFDSKISAMKCYGDELKSFPHPRSIEAIEAYAKKWGTMVGIDAAEPFKLIRKLNLRGENTFDKLGKIHEKKS